MSRLEGSGVRKRSKKFLNQTCIIFLLVLSAILPVISGSGSSNTTHKQEHHPLITDEAEARKFLEKVNVKASAACNLRALKDWAYSTNLTAYNKAQATEASVAYAMFSKNMSVELHGFDWKNFTDPLVKRQFKLLSITGLSTLPEDKLRKFNGLKQTMISVYSTANICSYSNKTKCDLNLVPEITEILKQSRDPEELKHVWVHWRNQTGRKLRKNFTEMVQLFNQAAKLNGVNYDAGMEGDTLRRLLQPESIISWDCLHGFPDGAEFELRAYESPTFREDVEKLWQKLRPLYAQLHAYVRHKLRNFYGSKIISAKGPIPAHLLGDMWSQSWTNLMDIVRPYNKASIDVTAKMLEKKMTAVDMAKLAEEFFTSIGFPPLPQTFWQNSLLEKPKNNNKIVCHASAWDFCDGNDFRIKQCTRIEMEDLIILHHEMGHTQYQMQYKDQPKTFRDGANPGFHEAIGDLMALSVQTPLHLQQIGLLDTVDDDGEGSINYLLSMALEKIAFLPFAYLMDLWRWNVFKGITTPENMNCEWWKLRLYQPVVIPLLSSNIRIIQILNQKLSRLKVQYQGIFPPVTRNEEQFDPGSKFHVTANSPYIQYFVSTILQFQMHKALCETAGKYDPSNKIMKPLHKCDIYRSHSAGQRLQQMLQLGSSKPWPDALETVTGQRTMDATAILDYFDPLMRWLEKENNKTGEPIGWEIGPNMTSCRGPKGKSPASSTTSRGVDFYLLGVYILAIICLNPMHMQP